MYFTGVNNIENLAIIDATEVAYGIVKEVRTIARSNSMLVKKERMENNSTYVSKD